jgi:hypothetical protein
MVNSRPELPADSFEVWRDHHLEKIRHLETRLTNLNLQDNPCEIEDICVQIIILRGMMKIKLRSLERR